MSSNPLRAACTHTTMGHLFYHVLCPTQSLITRVTTVVGGCLLLIGGLFTAYSRISRYISTSTPAAKSLAHQPIDLSVIDTLGLDLDEEATVDASKFEAILANYIPTNPFTLRQAATEVITKINKAIEEKSSQNPQASRQEKHSIILNTEAPWVKKGSNLYFYEQCCGGLSEPFALDKEQAGKLWFYRIIQALVDKTHIKIIRSYNSSYFIQT